jgi:hypothetical protein
MTTAPLPLICLVVALVFFALAAFWGWRYRDASRGWAVAVGLFFYALKDLLAILTVVAMLTIPTVAPVVYASELVVWDEAEEVGVPKGIIGNDGIRCIGESTNGDVTYRSITYIGADGDEMAADPSRERAWQAGHCRFMQELGHNGFWDQRNQPRQPVKISVEGV